MTYPERENTRLWYTVFFLWGWAFYFILGYDIGLHSQIRIDNNIILGTDTHRVYQDLLSPEGDHYRTKIHPLFVILFQPVGRLLAYFIHPPMAVLLLVTAVASLSVCLLHACLARIVTDRLCRWSLTALYFLSMSQMIYGTLPETFIFAGCTLIFMHYCFLRTSGRSMRMPLKILLGIMAIAVTTTNYAQFLILSLAQAWREDKKNRWRRYFIAVAGSFMIAVLLAMAQKAWYPSSIPFYTYLTNPEEDLRYTYVGSFSIYDLRDDGKNILWALVTNGIKDKARAGMFRGTLVRGWLLTNVKLSKNKFNMTSINFAAITSWQRTFGTVTTLLLIVLGILALRRRKNFPLLVPVIACLIFNLLLHLFYNFEESHLYTQHFLFLMIFIMAYGLATIESARARRLIAGLIILLAAIEGCNNLSNYMEMKRELLSYYRE